MRLFFSIFFFASLPLMACPEFVARRNINHPDGISINYSGLNSADLAEVINLGKLHYEEVFEAMGQELILRGEWEDDRFNAFAWKLRKQSSILIPGGMARAKFMTKDSLLLILCHEMGHHLGGYPTLFAPHWSSREGQADYFASLKCMKKILKGNPQNERISANLNLPESIKGSCRSQHTNNDDYYICLRTAKAAEDFAKADVYDYEKGELGKAVSLLSPSSKVVQEITFLYPDVQCRLDTMLQGALCNVSLDEATDHDDESKGTCHARNGHSVGLRPFCWFVPDHHL